MKPLLRLDFSGKRKYTIINKLNIKFRSPERHNEKTILAKYFEFETSLKIDMLKT